MPVAPVASFISLCTCKREDVTHVRRDQFGLVFLESVILVSVIFVMIVR